MWFLVVIYFFIPESETQIYYSTSNTTYCYDNHPPSNSRPPQPLFFCVECGCFETILTEHTLSCKENEVIRMEYINNPIKSRPFNHDNNTCILTRNGYCYNGFGDNNLTTTYTDRIEVYRNCTLHNTCTVTLNPVEEGNVKLVRYPYVCENDIQDISRPFSRIQSNPVFYFKGIDYINKTIDCDCSVYNSPKNIEVEIFYLDGDNFCNKLDILPGTNVLSCEEDVQLYTASKNIQSKFLKIEIRNMTVTGDEVVFFKVHGDDLNVICTGCITRLESVDTPSTTTLSIPILSQQTTSTNLNSGRSSSTKPESTTGQTSSDLNLKTSSESTTTNLNIGQTSSDLNPKTSSESTTTNLNIGQTSGQNEADFISKTEHEEKLNQNNAMFGGIIAGIIILVLLGIGIYCFVSKRRKGEKVKKEDQQSVSPQDDDGGEYTHYNYVDLDVLKETETSNKETETSKLNKSGGKSTNPQPVQQTGAVQKPKENNMEINSTVSPNLYHEIETGFESETTKKSDALRKPEEKKQTNEVCSEPKKFYAEKQKAVTHEPKAVTQEQKEVTQEQKAVTQEQKEVTQERKAVTQERKSVTQEQKAVTQEQKGANIFSNTDDPVEDTYNHIGDSNKLTPKVVTQEQSEVTQEQKGVKSIPNIVSNTDDPVEDTYNHIGDTNKLMPKAVTQEQKGAKSIPNIVSNTDDPAEDTCNHIGDTNKPITGRIKVLPKKYTKPIAKLKPIRYNHNPTENVPATVVTLNPNQPDNLNNPTDEPKPVRYNHNPTETESVPTTVVTLNPNQPDNLNNLTDKPKPVRYNHNPIDSVPTTVVTLNPNQPENLINRQVKPNPSTDDYSHVNVKTQQFPKPSQTNYDHIDGRLVIMDSPVDRENTYSHIENLPKVKTPQPSPRMKDKVPQSDDLSTAEDFYENVVLDQEVKADNSVEATSLYNDEFEDTYNHLESTGIVNL